jgi:23S rRNA pseudouridine1911/1915/1917 synthase
VRSRDFGKCYYAIVHGEPKNDHDKLVHYLHKDTRSNTVSVVDERHPDAKEAILQYETLGSSNGLSLVYVELHTGRSHQIRVQFAAIGCSLYGDQRYGVVLNHAGQQIALWSAKLAFAHPTLREQVVFTSKPPMSSYPWNLWPAAVYSRVN